MKVSSEYLHRTLVKANIDPKMKLMGKKLTKSN
jgi:hypothetical protein